MPKQYHLSGPARPFEVLYRAKRRFGLFLGIVISLICAASQGASLNARLEQAQTHLKANEAGKALDIYRELQVEYPNSEQAIFGTGCAEYCQGEAKLSLNTPEEAVSSFTEARATFERLIQSKDDRTRISALFNRSNCLAQLAKISSANPEQREQGITALREAIGAYESVLKEDPQHAGARQNLDHLRYVLKKMLQEKKEEDKKQEKKQDDKQKNEDPKMVSVFTQASTDIANAQAKISAENNTVELVLPVQGAQP